jgi:Polyketide cyclase / dehydrase and lipid transport
VAEFAADPTNAPAWYRNIKTVRWETEPAVTVGARMAFVASFLGRELAYTYEIRELDAGRRLVMSTSEGPFPMETTYVWEDAGPGQTRMALRNRGEATGYPHLASPFVSFSMRRANTKDLRRLKALLESGGSVG